MLSPSEKAPDGGTAVTPTSTRHGSSATQVDEAQDAPAKVEHSYTSRQMLQIISAFFVFFNTWGLVLSFGVLQTYYTDVLFPEKSGSDVAWISTVCCFLLLISGTITGSLYDRGFHHALLVAGSLLEVFGVMMLSISTEYYQVFLSQAVCVGLGGGLLYVPSIAAASASFDIRNRGRVMGLVATGTGIGGIIYPILLRHLLQNLSFGWAIRIVGFVLLGTFVISWCVLLQENKRPASIRRLIDSTAFTDLPFLSICVAAFFSGAAYYIPLLFLPSFSQTEVPTLKDSDLVFYLLSITNGSSIIGRLVAGIAADRYGPLEVNLVARIASAVVLLCWIAVRSVAGVVVWSVAWGLATSAIVSLPGAIVPLLCPSPAVIGSRIGIYWAGNAVGFLIGGPASVALANSEGRNILWWHLQLFAGLLMLVSVYFCIYSMQHVRKARR